MRRGQVTRSFSRCPKRFQTPEDDSHQPEASWRSPAAQVEVDCLAQSQEALR